MFTVDKCAAAGVTLEDLCRVYLQVVIECNCFLFLVLDKWATNEDM